MEKRILKNQQMAKLLVVALLLTAAFAVQESEIKYDSPLITPGKESSWIWKKC
jgi:hypothetical protein